MYNFSSQGRKRGQLGGRKSIRSELAMALLLHLPHLGLVLSETLAHIFESVCLHVELLEAVKISKLCFLVLLCLNSAQLSLRETGGTHRVASGDGLLFSSRRHQRPSIIVFRRRQPLFQLLLLAQSLIVQMEGHISLLLKLLRIHQIRLVPRFQPLLHSMRSVPSTLLRLSKARHGVQLRHCILYAALFLKNDQSVATSLKRQFTRFCFSLHMKTKRRRSVSAWREGTLTERTPKERHTDQNVALQALQPRLQIFGLTSGDVPTLVSQFLLFL